MENLHKSCILFLTVFILIGCEATHENQKRAPLIVNDTLSSNLKKGSTVYSLDTTVFIGSGFEVSCKQDEFSDNNNGSFLLVKHNNKTIYIDRSEFYVLDDSLNPTLIALGNDLFEIFLEVDDRPNKNYLKMLKIQSDKVIDSQKTPAFSLKPCHLFDDTSLVYADSWGYPEAWTDSNNRDLVTCDPIMYYRLTKNGLILDSNYTIKKNKEIFGIPNVFTEKELRSIPVNKDNARKKEIERIKNCR